MADIRGLTSSDGTFDTCSVLTCSEGTVVTLPDSTLRDGAVPPLLVLFAAGTVGGGLVVRGGLFSTRGESLVMDAVVTCREETVFGGML
jgi:hypothetical protein